MLIDNLNVIIPSNEAFNRKLGEEGDRKGIEKILVVECETAAVVPNNTNKAEITMHSHHIQ